MPKKFRSKRKTNKLKKTGTRKRPHSKAEVVNDYPVNARTMRAFCLNWLRYKHGCFVTAFERLPWTSKIKPDVLGLDKSRRLIEVEIKIDLQDFKKDATKAHRVRLLDNLRYKNPRCVNFLYYFVPPKLLNYVMENVPDHAGVLTFNPSVADPYTGFPMIDVMKPAVRLHDNRLSIRDSLIMVRDMAGTIAAVTRDEVRHLTKLNKLKEDFIAIGGVIEKKKRKKKKKKQNISEAYANIDASADNDDNDDNDDSNESESDDAKEDVTKRKSKSKSVEKKKSKLKSKLKNNKTVGKRAIADNEDDAEEDDAVEGVVPTKKKKTKKKKTKPSTKDKPSSESKKLRTKLRSKQKRKENYPRAFQDFE